jgi:ketosteroid isomerase-like protein
MTTSRPPDRALRPEDVDVLLARAFAAQDVDACAALYHPEARVVRLADFGRGVAKRDAAIRDVMAGYVGLAPTMDLTVHHVPRAGDLALVRSQWKIRGVDGDGDRIELHHHGMEVMRRAADGSWQFYIDHPWVADPSWAVDAPSPVAAER